MTTPSSSLIPTASNNASTLNSGSDSVIPRAVMNTTQMRELAEAMTDPPNPGSVTRRWGIIAAFNGAPDFTVDVTIGGVLTHDLAYDAAYTPTVNEVVMLDVVGTDTVVVGTTAPGGWRTGEIEATFLPTPKAGALFCQGQTLSRTTYANLWSWITAHGLAGGKPFGNGDGSTTFTLPDLRGRVAIGAGTLGSDTYAVGDTPGAARVTLATNQMPAHSHAPTATATTTVTQAAHTHSFSATSGGESAHTHNVGLYASGNEASGYGLAAGGVFNDRAMIQVAIGSGWTTSSGGTNHSHTVSGTTGSTTATSTAATSVTVTESTIGGSTPVDVRQPAFVVNWLIYV